MKQLITLILLTAMTACGTVQNGQIDDTSVTLTDVTENTETNESVDNMSAIKMTIGEAEFSITLADNDTARAFTERLPMTLDMSELNGNEKYFYLDENLPSASQSHGQISTGDLMLYGDSCVVLFYKDFQTSYSYTRLGKVQDTSGLADAVGKSDVTITFEVTHQKR